MTTDLQEAFREAARREFAMVPDESELDYTFSPGFQRKMHRIIRAQVHGYWNMVNTLGKRIAIAAAIIVMLLTTAMAIKPIRERVIKFFVEVYEECFEIRFGRDKKGDIDLPKKSMTSYTLARIPEGYHETDKMSLDIFMRKEWANDKGYKIILKQQPGTHEITLDHEAADTEFIVLGSIQILAHTVDDTKTYIWEQDGYVFYLSIYDEIAVDETLNIIKSLIPEE